MKKHLFLLLFTILFGTCLAYTNGHLTFVSFSQGETLIEDADVVFTNEEFNGLGTSGMGSEVNVVKNGVTFNCTRGFGDLYGIRCYKNSVVTITSAEQQIAKIVFEFATVSGTYYNGDLEDTIIVNGMSWTNTVTNQARMNKVKIYFGTYDVYDVVYTYDTIMGVVSGPTRLLHEDSITFEAIPNTGYHFTQWSDGIADNPRTIYLSQDTTFTAEFAPNMYTSTTISANPEWGSTYGDTIAAYGEEIVIYAVANEGYHFVSWANNNTQNPRTLTVISDGWFTAWFAKNIYTVTAQCNPEMGYVHGPTQAEYLDEVTISAIPNNGYHFTQWSDGVKDNPRTFVITQDTAFSAEFILDVIGTCGDNNQLTWTFDSISCTLAISGTGALNSNYTFGAQAPTQTKRLIIEKGVTSIGNYAFYGMGATITSLALPNSLTTIGDSAFMGLNNRKFNTLILPNTIVSIGAHAFDGASYLKTIHFGSVLEEIGDYAFNGCSRVQEMTCLAEITPNVGTNGLTSINSLAKLYIPNDYLFEYQIDPNWSRFVLSPIGAKETNITTDDVTVTTDDNTATLTWPTNNAADTYTIEITKDGVVFCTLIFNSNGQLTGIAFALSRNCQPHAPAATMSANGMQFTVTGLNSSTNYSYTITSNNGNTVLASYTGEFETTGAPAITTDMENPSAKFDEATKILRNNQILILRGDKVYTITGVEVK